MSKDSNTPSVPQLQARIADLEDRLHVEELERADFEASQAKLLEKLHEAETQVALNVALVSSTEARLEIALQQRGALLDVTRQNVGDAYNLLTQGESPTQLRGPSARRIYDRSKAALKIGEGEWWYSDGADQWWTSNKISETLSSISECADGHDTGEMLWPGTAHQGVVCRRCKVFLPC